MNNKFRVLGYESMISELEDGFHEYFTGKFSLKDLESEYDFQRIRFDVNTISTDDLQEVHEYFKSNNLEINIKNISEFLQGQLDYRLSELITQYIKCSKNPEVYEPEY